jgi:hypothetical protein
MNATTQLRIPGPLSLAPAAGGIWCLGAAAAPATRVYLRGFEPPATLADCTAVTVEWLHEGGARLTFLSPTGGLAVPAASAFAHTFRDDLYAALPLASLDARQRRFWRRVFLLVRLPGARRILRWVAEAAR